MVEFLDAVAHLYPGCVELSDAFDQGGQSRVHRRLCSLSFDKVGGQEFVIPRRLNMHVHQKPFLLRMFLATLEECQNVLIAMMAAQR
jgi:hypothetical protein